MQTKWKRVGRNVDGDRKLKKKETKQSEKVETEKSDKRNYRKKRKKRTCQENDKYKE